MKNTTCTYLVFCLASILLSSGEVRAQANPFLKFQNVTLTSSQTLYPSGQIIVAPPGNGPVKLMPEYPARTVARLALSLTALSITGEGRTQVGIQLGQEKIPQIMARLAKEGLLKEAVRLAKLFKFDVLHILGPVLGENTYNAFIDTTLQNSYHKIFQQSDIATMSERMGKIVNNIETAKCLEADMLNYWKWRCVLFYSSQGAENSNSDLMYGFVSGQKNSGTLGLVQMQPFLLWSLNDIAVSIAGVEKFEITDLEKPTKTIFDNKKMLAYVAANAAASIHIYKYQAGVDISQNPGLTTSLFNLGDEYRRAYEYGLKRSSSAEVVYPEVNYLGWFVNRNASLIRAELSKYN